MLFGPSIDYECRPVHPVSVVMPYDNNFQHAKYSRADPGERAGYRMFQAGPAFDSEGWRLAMGQLGAQLMAARVKGFLFLSGHPYMDLFGAARLDEVGGLKRGYSRGISGLESLLALLRPDTNEIYSPKDPIHPPLRNDAQTHKVLDQMAQDVGNFSASYVQQLLRGLQGTRAGDLVGERFVWSSVNHHLGRVEAVIDLLEFLSSWLKTFPLSEGSRVLLVGHGHAGQVMALLSNLVSTGEAEARPRIFEILARYCEACPAGHRSLDRLEQLYKLISDGDGFAGLLNGAVLDMVTLGTPVRYGWDTSAIGQLMHIVNHRPVRPDGKRWLSKMDLPQIAWEMPYVSGGDYVQQLAVAGTDEWPATEAAQQAVSELRDILEPYDGFERWLECARRNTRCPNDGTCVLVDYPVQPESTPRQHLYGHGCYTGRPAMLFTVKEIINGLYSGG